MVDSLLPALFDLITDGLIEAQDTTILKSAFREERTVQVASVAEAIEAAGSGFARVPWDQVGAEGEDRLAEAGVSVRCLQAADGSLAPEDGQPLVAVVGKSY